MTYTIEKSLYNFPAWSGGKDTLDTLIQKGDCSSVESLIDEVLYLNGDEVPSDTNINDFLWFERDTIAQHLGYENWDEYEYGKDEEYDDEDEEWDDDEDE